jgi:hypothetical protein
MNAISFCFFLFPESIQFSIQRTRSSKTLAVKKHQRLNQSRITSWVSSPSKLITGFFVALFFFFIMGKSS